MHEWILPCLLLFSQPSYPSAFIFVAIFVVNLGLLVPPYFISTSVAKEPLLVSDTGVLYGLYVLRSCYWANPIPDVTYNVFGEMLNLA